MNEGASFQFQNRLVITSAVGVWLAGWVGA
jgi:hypothetical protein